MEISVIASGSNGNCCMVEDKGTSLLIDAGKSCKEIQKRMSILGKCIEDVSAVLVTHRHSDHIRGADVISRKFNIPVYISTETSKEVLFAPDAAKIFSIDKQIKIGGISIKPVATSHNVASCGFVINKKFGIMTDTGCVTKQMEDAVKNLKAVLIESNHDIDMVIKGKYPYFLKQWILSNEGHLSNIDASNMIERHSGSLELAILGHLSGNNNTPELAMKTFNTLVRKKMDVVVADRNKETGSFCI